MQVDGIYFRVLCSPSDGRPIYSTRNVRFRSGAVNDPLPAAVTAPRTPLFRAKHSFFNQPSQGHRAPVYKKTWDSRFGSPTPLVAGEHANATLAVFESAAGRQPEQRLGSQLRSTSHYSGIKSPAAHGGDDLAAAHPPCLDAGANEDSTISDVRGGHNRRRRSSAATQISMLVF